MDSIKITTETRIGSKNEDLITYWDSYISIYNIIFRDMWQRLTYEYKNKKNTPKHKLNTEYQIKYNVSKRTVNSIWYQVNGTLKSLIELKKTEQDQRRHKIKELKKDIVKTDIIIEALKPIVTENKATPEELKYYRMMKKKIYNKRQKLNRILNKYNAVREEIKNREYKLCFGTKNFFNKQNHLKENNFHSHERWYNLFVKNRDKNIYYLGSSDETAGNQMFQLVYNKSNDSFILKVRKEYSGKEDKYVYGTVSVKYQKELLIKHLEDKDCPISYRVRRVENRWYLQIILTVQRENILTRTDNGTIGLDYNDGFIAVSETNRHGNLVDTYRVYLKHHGTGNKAKTEIEQAVCSLVRDALDKGKDIVIEDLDFKKTKSEMGVYGNKKYNKMIHAFDYSRYKKTLHTTAFRNGVGLTMVDPAYTSKKGREKYSPPMKLSVHNAAAFVIARMGQGFQDAI